MSVVIYTDLDGSLLDHYDYSYSAALPALAKLAAQNIPLVPVSSKTRAEIEPLRKSLSLSTPFIVENGAAIFIPVSERFNQFINEDLQVINGYRVKAFSPDIMYWNSVIEELSLNVTDAFTAFSQLSVDDVVDLTGLTHEQAGKACRREFSDPLYWYGSESKFRQLQDLCQQLGVEVVRGGRFVHLLKGADKGRAVSWLHKALSAQSPSPLSSIVLGDGENDIAMLSKADFPVQIKSPTHAFPAFTHPSLYQTEKEGPAGWNEAILKLI